MKSCKVHNVRYYNLVPSAIHCIDYESTYKKLALSRSDNRIEVWDLREVPHMECLIPNLRNNSVESLSWCNERLFSTGLHGFLVEYDMSSLSIKCRQSLTAGPGWCLAINKQKSEVAVGTEDGYINLFSIKENEFVYEKIMDKQEGRILCIAWESSGKMIVTGSCDTIRIWDVQTGHAIHKMTTGRVHLNVETIVWCLAVTSDFTIITGDSRGTLSIWSGHRGVLVQSFNTHKADILSLCLSKEEDVISFGGVDPAICDIIRVNGDSYLGNDNRWARSVVRRIHDHDVRALASSGRKLISGGVDGYLAFSSGSPRVCIKYPPLLQHPFVCICKDVRYILLRYGTHLEVWHLGKDLEHPETTKLLCLESAGKDLIVCAALSNNGKWLAYSTPVAIRFFSFEFHEDAQEPLLQKIIGIPEEVGPSQHILFTPNSCNAVVVTDNMDLIVLKLGEGYPTVLYSIQLLEEKFLTGRVYLLSVSSNGKYLVAADHKSNIIVWTLSDGKYYCTLPCYYCPPTALGIQPETDFLFVVYSNHTVVEYSLPQRSFTDFSHSLSKMGQSQWLNKLLPIRGVTFDPRNLNIVVLYDDATMHVINKAKELPNSSAKIPRLDSSHCDSIDSCPSSPKFPEPKHALHVIKKYKHLVHLEWLVDDELVAVEVSPATLMEHLPPIMQRKRFGN